jgi:hypothetical protein
MSTSVKYFHSAMTGAPTMSGTAGALIAVLDACLINGFNVKTVDTLVVSNNVATMNMSTGVGAFEVDAVVLVSGATPAGLNGEQRITAVTANSVSFATTGIANQTATGSISAKIAPAGWAKALTGTNLAAYRSADVTGTRMFLRVDDTSTTNARVVAYESMTDINTGLQPCPTATQISGGGYWPKANAANATARPWTLIADGKTFYLHVHTLASGLGNSGVVGAFGDFLPYKSGDVYASFLHCFTADVAALTTNQTGCLSYASGSTEYVARSYTGLGSAVAGATLPEAYNPTSYSGSGSSTPVPLYPNGPDNSLVLTRKLIYEPGVCLRGVMPGVLFAVQSCASSFSWRAKIAGQGAYTGRQLMAVKCSSPAGVNGVGALFFDITGPWA